MPSRFADLAAALFPLRTALFTDLQYADRPGATVSLYRPDGQRRPPLAILFHGGGWTKGSPAKNVVLATPLMLAGWAVANVRYRLASEAPAPAALADAIAAIERCFAAALDQDIDEGRVVLFGISAGAHLALCAGLAPDLLGAGAGPRPRVAAVVDLYGVADPAALLDGPDAQPFARAWFGDGPEAATLADHLSPVRLAVAPVAPPAVFIAHGREDRLVPCRQSEQLHAGLAAAGADVELLVVPGDHGHFTPAARRRLFAGMEDFLSRRGLWPER